MGLTLPAISIGITRKGLFHSVPGVPGGMLGFVPSQRCVPSIPFVVPLKVGLYVFIPLSGVMAISFVSGSVGGSVSVVRYIPLNVLLFRIVVPPVSIFNGRVNFLGDSFSR